MHRLYRRHQTELCRYIKRTFGIGPPDPEDVVQATFARFAAVANAGDIRNPRAFLFRTAYNLAVDARRHDSRFRAVARDVQILEGESHECGSDDVIASRQEVKRLDEALANLPDMQRTALLMHRLDGLSFAEIGRQIGYSPAGARQLVCKALDACIAMMESPE